MFEGWTGVLVILGIEAFAADITHWLLGGWYWFWHKHTADRATYEVIARCAYHPGLEGRGQFKIQAMPHLVNKGEAKT